MTKKSTHWVTIPEEAIHTPASKSAKKSENMTGKGKLFWGAGFIVLVIVTVALLAPQQMANILQGNLFEQSGFEPLEIIPAEEPPAEAEPAEAEPAEESEDVIAVEADTDAVSIQIEPVAIDVEEPAEEEEPSEECIGSDPAKPGEPDEECLDEQAEEPAEEQAEESAEATGTIKEELDANRQLLEELSQQIADFKEKDEQKTEIIEDLTGIVQEQMEEARPSAPTVIPPAVTTTTAIGQLPTGYRVNTHTVATTPHQVLQQNTAQLQMQQTAAAPVEDYRAQLSQLDGTTDSGPKEALLLALTLAFVALLGWKIAKFARA